MRFHVKSDGSLGRCEAQFRCPFGDALHVEGNDLKEAYSKLEATFENEKFGKLSKGTEHRRTSRSNASFVRQLKTMDDVLFMNFKTESFSKGQVYEKLATIDFEKLEKAVQNTEESNIVRFYELKALKDNFDRQYAELSKASTIER